MAKYNRRPTDPKKKPKKGTKEYYEWMASKRESDHKKAKEERDKRGVVGSAVDKSASKSGAAGVKAYHAKTSNDCNTNSSSCSVKGKVYRKSDRRVGGTPYKGETKTASEAGKESMEKDVKILKGQGSGSSEYKELAKEKTASKLENRDAVKSIREEYYSKMKGKNYEDRKRMKAEMDKKINDLKAKKKSSDTKSKQQFESNAKDTDSSLKMGTNKRRR